VWLDVPLERLNARGAGGRRRPLASDRGAFERLYLARRPATNRPIHRVDAARVSIDAIVEQLLDYLGH
jgi:hypothetical protein